MFNILRCWTNWVWWSIRTKIFSNAPIIEHELSYLLMFRNLYPLVRNLYLFYANSTILLCYLLFCLILRLSACAFIFILNARAGLNAMGRICLMCCLLILFCWIVLVNLVNSTRRWKISLVLFTFLIFVLSSNFHFLRIFSKTKDQLTLILHFYNLNEELL